MSDCIFCRIVRGEATARAVYQDDRAVAFHDINPQAPVHMLVIPRKHLSSLAEAGADDTELLGHLMRVGASLAQEHGLGQSGFRSVINTGAGAGQSVFHLHLHILGGRPMAWPPG